MRLHFSFPYCNIQDVVPQFPIKCSVEWVDAEDPLFLLYTSGSTGKPKAPNYPDSGRCWDIVDKYKVTIFYTAPTLVRSLMRESDEVITLGLKSDGLTSMVCVQITPLPGAWPQKPGSATFPFFGIQIKGQGIYAFVTLVEGIPYSEELRKSLVLAVRNQVFGVEPGPGICRGPEEEKDEIRSAAAIYFPHPTSADKKELALVVLCLTETLHDNSTSYGKRGFR
ncbi:hypothetical protein BHE74_00009664 [Ensete ventricosum]|nr:hypothetical protein BHE74_00009664 [Ensete ventricosum]